MRELSTQKAYHPFSGIRRSFRSERFPFAARGVLHHGCLVGTYHFGRCERCRLHWLSYMEKQTKVVRTECAR